MRLTKFIDHNIAFTVTFSGALRWVAVGTTAVFVNMWLTSPAAAASFTTASNAFTDSMLTRSSFDYESTHIIANGLYARPSSSYSRMTSGGAFGINADYAAGLSNEWYVEEQRHGADALISGLINKDDTAIAAGFNMFDWRFSQQLADGSFGGTGDAFHSTSMFIESVAYSLLTLEDTPNGSQYTDAVNLYTPMLHSAAKWMIQDDIWNRGLSNNSPYSHRNYIVAGALGLTSKLTGDQELLAYSEQSIEDGLSKQLDNGVNPELGGYDSSYQMVGANYAMRWFALFAAEADSSLTASVSSMLEKALSWEESRILATGEISTEGNTRVPSLEQSRSGQNKKLDHRNVIKGFSYWSSVTGNVQWDVNARKIGQYYYSDDEKVLTAFNTSVVVDFSEAQSVPEGFSILSFGLFGFACFSFSGRAKQVVSNSK